MTDRTSPAGSIRSDGGGSRSRSLLLAVLCTAQFVTLLDFSIVTVALPEIALDLNIDSTLLPWVLNAYGLAIAALLVFGGRLADLFGRREIFFAGMAIFGLTSLLAGFAQDPAFLVAMRALQGVGAALVTPAALSIVTTVYTDPRERGRALGIWGAVLATGLTAGLVFGAVITQALGWRWVLWVTVPVAFAALVLTPILLPTSLRRQSGRLDLPGAALAVTGLAALVLGIGQIETVGLSVRSLLPVLASAVLLVGYVVWERRAAQPLTPLSVLGSRSVVSANLVSVAGNAAMAPAWVLLSLYLQLVHEVSVLVAGMLLVPAAVAIAGGSGVLAPRLLRLLSRRALVVAGMAICAVGMLALALSLDDTIPWAWTLPGGILAGLGYGLAFTPWALVGVDRIPERHQGIASGLLVTSQEVGAAIGIALAVAFAAYAGAEDMGSPSDLAHGYRIAMFALVVLAAIGAILGRLVPRDDVGDPDASAEAPMEARAA
jgi:EmrB/QacA subfamily drug resistance transporter